MKKLAITSKMSVDEQRQRLMINDSLYKMQERGMLTENNLKNYLLRQLEEKSMRMTYLQAFGYYKEIVGF